jgi:methylated-DNA-[protein]-cysteine S-methyltransferase
MILFLDRVPSPLGTLTVVTNENALVALDFDDYAERMQRLLRVHYGDFTLRTGRERLGVRHALDAYFAGDLRAPDTLPVHTNGTEFQRAVWRALREIPAGTTLSYGALARRLGKPQAMRAVGLANGANPIGIVVPCHRVIGANGTLTGYGSGIARKRWLLEHESGAIALRNVTLVLEAERERIGARVGAARERPAFAVDRDRMRVARPVIVRAERLEHVTPLA